MYPINAVAEFQKINETLSDAVVKSGKDLISFDVKEIQSEDQVEDVIHDNNANKDDNEDYLEVYDEILGSFFKEAIFNDTSVAKKKLHDYDETSGKESDNEFNNVGKEDKILVSKETSDELFFKDNKAVVDDFKGTTSQLEKMMTKEVWIGNMMTNDQPCMENSQKIFDDKLENEESSHVGAASQRIFSSDGCGPSASPGIFFPGGCVSKMLETCSL